VPTSKIEQSKIVDTTGAGDCFVGSFAARELDNSDMNLEGVTASCEFACRAAGVSVQGKGTQSSYPATRKEVFARS
jgi:sugar/nucleoside kinase (ribokinase family)